MNDGEMMAQPYEQIPQADPMLEQPMAEAEPAAEAVTLERGAMLGELLAWSNDFITKSANWRRSSYEDKWRKFQMNADSIYDEALAKNKEPWQSKAFWPITASHLENAIATLFKTEIGPNPPFDVKPRPGIVDKNIPGSDQSDNIKDLVLREREKSEYEINRNAVIIDKAIFGSGFMQVYFETVIEDRLVWEDVVEELTDMAAIERSAMGQPMVVGRRRVVKPKVIYRGVRARHIPILDVFPDPQAITIEGHPIGMRYRTTYEQILEGAKPTPEGQPGYVLPEAVENLKDTPSMESTPTDKQATQSDREISEARIERTKQGRVFECYEIQARLPKKWVLIDGQDIDDPEALIPARVRFHKSTIIGVSPSENYDGQPDIIKDDYMTKAASFYGVGIPEMLADDQAVINELSNQVLDAGTVSLLNVYAVIEKSVVDSKDFTMGPGSVIRFKAKDGLTNIDQLFKKIDMGSIDRNSMALIQERERSGQQRTSITSTTLGTEDNAQMTLGAQQIQQGVTGGKLAYLGMMSEKGFQRKVFHAFYKNIYSNYSPEDYALAIGPERAATVVSLTPEQLNNQYGYVALGIFEVENKGQRQAQLAAWDSQFGQMPWANRLEVAKEELRAMGQDADRFVLPEAEASQIMMKAEQMAGQMLEQQAAQQAPQGPPK